MASKINWIAFILYISIYMPESFSTTLEPSSESSHVTSLSTGSTNNASDITNTSILSLLTSSPSPEAPTRVQETPHISEELNTQFSVRTTVLLDLEDLNHNGTTLPVNTASSVDAETNSTMTLEENSKSDLSNKRHRQSHIQKKHTTSTGKLSYAKSSYMKKQVMSKNSQDFSDKSALSSLVVMNETSEPVERTWGNESDVSNQTQSPDVYNSGLTVFSEAIQALDKAPDFRKMENNTERRKKKIILHIQEIQFQTESSEEQKAGENYEMMKASTTNPFVKLETDSVTENIQDMNGSSVSNILLNGSEVNTKDSSESANEEHPNYDGHSTHFVSSDNLGNSASPYNNVSASLEEPSSVKPHEKSSQSRKRRSSDDNSSSSVTAFPENYPTASPYDGSSNVTHSTSTPSSEYLTRLMATKAENTDGSEYVADDVTQSAVKNSPSQSRENFSDTLPVTTLHSDTLPVTTLHSDTLPVTTLHSDTLPVTTLHSDSITSINEQKSSAISSMLSTIASEAIGSTYFVREASGSPPASSTEGVAVPSKASVSETSNGKDVSKSNISGDSVSTKPFAEEAPTSEGTVASAMPLCKDEEEIDVESTSEISIKVFPLCAKQVSKTVTFVSSSEGSIFGTPTSTSTITPSTEIQTVDTHKSESAGDSTKTSESIHEGSKAEEHSENITVSYKSLVITEPATSPEANSEGANLESISARSSFSKVLSEDAEVPQNELGGKATEASDALNIEVHSNMNDVMEMQFTEVGGKQDHSKDGITMPSEKIEAYENRSLNVHTEDQMSGNKTDSNFPFIKPTLHQNLKEIVSNSSSSSFDYVADQSEVLPVMVEPPSQNISFIQDFTSRKEIKIMQDPVPTDISIIYPVVNITSEESESHQNNESLDAAVITALEKPDSTNTPERNLSTTSLSEISLNHTLVGSASDGNQEAKTENFTSTETKIAGVGVKTTVSVSLNVTKTNGTKIGNTSKNGISDSASPLATSTNLTSINQKLFIDLTKLETPFNQNVTDSSKSPDETPLGSPNMNSADPSKPPEGTPSPLPQPSTTTRRSFGIRKPKLRLNGESSEGPVTRKPFFVKTPPTRASEVISPSGIFQKNRTRLGSITSSTTPSTTARASWKPFVGQPMTWRYGLENFTFIPEVETVPTTTEEEVQDTGTETFSFATLSDHDTFQYKVPGSIVVRKGINCLSEHFKSKHSPEYRARARVVRRMLHALLLETEIGQEVLDIHIDSIHCRKSKNITVDYNLFLSKAIPKNDLVKIFNNRLENSTFNKWILDLSRTTFDDPIKEAVNTPAPSTEDAEPPIPQWAIAVIVIGAASLVFIILFGALTVYGRHHMRRRYNGNRLGDDDVDRAIDSREWDDKMAATYENLAADGIYDIDDGGFDSVKRGPYGHPRHSKVSRHDSWKSDWNERPRRSRYPDDF